MTKVLFCIDSDGAAMDTMTYKHELFFGPIAAEKFMVTDKETFQKNWENINLYSETRGVNRFTGLVMSLESINYDKIDIVNLKEWVKTTPSLSNKSLETEITKKKTKDLKLALEWSITVNKELREAEGYDKAFENALISLEKLSKLGTVYVVSSANLEAVEDEWTRHGLIEFVEDLYCQDRGQKVDVLAKLIKDGAKPENILMVGDSPGDLEAAQKNNILFYPILVGREKESWKNLYENISQKVVHGEFTQKNQDFYINEFWNNLRK